jgi:glycosyltransferase involved in cell wall biosynthesis
MLMRADVVLATCRAEEEWIRKYEPRVRKIELTDLRRFFNFNHETHGGEEGGSFSLNHEIHEIHEREEERPLHLLYLGRRHPLKGVEYLEEAVSQLTRSPFPVPRSPQLKIVSNAFGEEKERVWEWCDVLVLPTLSENFGLVVAEALERGKRVITTDGAPAWGDGNDYGGRLVYLKGYRNGSSEERVRLLKNAIEGLQDESGSCLDSKSV